MARSVEEACLGADQLGEFHSAVQKVMTQGDTCIMDETYITEEVESEDPEAMEFKVFGSRGTNLLVRWVEVRSSSGWLVESL